MTPLLEIHDLHVTFSSSVHALAGVGLQLHAGKSLGIVGESGCGKSSIAKAIIRLLPKTARMRGQILYKGRDLLALPENVMETVRGKEIGMILQDTALNPTMTVGAQIMEGYRRHFPMMNASQREMQVKEMLSKVGLQHTLFKAYPHTLSGGMRQRIMIAIALSCNPQVLIADEPTTALDVTIQAQILDLIQDLQQELNMSLILITHDLSLIAKYCDEVLVMYAGKVVESASVYDLFAHPQHPYTQALLQAIPAPDHPKHLPLPVASWREPV